MRLTLSTKNDRGIAARFAGANKAATKGAKRAVREIGEEAYARAYSAAPKRSHFLADHLLLLPDADWLRYELGFRGEDFLEAGHDEYFIYVIFGTIYMDANDFLFPSHEAAKRHLGPKLTKEIGIALHQARLSRAG